MLSTLKQTRTRLCLSQQALADALGVSKRTIARWERAGYDLDMHWIYILKLDQLIAAQHTAHEEPVNAPSP